MNKSRRTRISSTRNFSARGIHLTLFCLVSLFSCILHPALSHAQVFDNDYVDGGDTSLRVGLGLQSDRVFRGQNLYNGTSLQPQVRAGLNTGLGVLYVDGFSHFAVDNSDSGITPQTRHFNEFDFALGHDFIFDAFQVGGGYRWYTYSRSDSRLKDTGEVFANIETSVIAHPHFLAAYDTRAHHGWYYEAGLKQPIALGSEHDKNSIIPAVSMGMSSSLDNGPNQIYDGGGVAFVDVALTGEFYFDDEISLRPGVHYNEGIDDNATSDFVFGVDLVGELGAEKR